MNLENFAKFASQSGGRRERMCRGCAGACQYEMYGGELDHAINWNRHQVTKIKFLTAMVPGLLAACRAVWHLGF